MQAEDARIKSLHQEASSYYLRGEFQQALEVWRGLIELDPDDERAKEGVRLCELLVDEGATAAPGPSPSPAPAEPSERPPFAEAAEGFDEDLDELDEILESGLGSSPAAEPPEPPAAEPPAQEGTGAAEEESAVFFDFSNVPEAADPPGADQETESDQQAGQLQIDLSDPTETESMALGESSGQPAPVEQQSADVDLPLDAGTAEPEKGPEATAAEPPQDSGTQEAAAAELRSRVNELLAEALTAYEQDHKEEALAILNRIFILDENNHAALALHDNIRMELEAEQGTATEDGASESAVEGEDGADEAVSAEAAGEQEPLEGLPLELDAAAEAPAAAAEAPLEDVFEDLDDGAELPAEKPPKRRLLGEGLLTRQNVFVAAALIVVVGAGGFLAFTFMGGSGESAESDGNAAAGVGPAVAVVLEEGADNDGPAPVPAEADGAEPAEPGPARQDPELLARRLEELLEQARQAMAREDWSAAVFACNQALEIDPANTAAREDLAEAGKRYREERALEQRHQQAIEAFNDGNYRSALTLLYRLPPGEDGGRIERYKRNGWYNMGVQALAVGDCKSATTNLGEALGIDPEDSEILLALDLAKICPYQRDTQTYRDEVRELPLRGLDD